MASSAISRKMLVLCLTLFNMLLVVTTMSAAATYPSAITVSPNIIASLGTATITVRINILAPAGGQKVGMAYGNLLTGPSTVTVPEGSNSTTAQVTAGSATGTTSTFVRAYIGQAGQVANVTVKAAAGTYTLESVQVRPMPLHSGENGSMSIALSGSAPAGGVEVMLSSSDSRALPVPPTVIIPEGSRSVLVKVIAGMTDADKNVTITAKRQQVTKTTTVTLLKRK